TAVTIACSHLRDRNRAVHDSAEKPREGDSFWAVHLEQDVVDESDARDEHYDYPCCSEIEELPTVGESAWQHRIDNERENREQYRRPQFGVGETETELVKRLLPRQQLCRYYRKHGRRERLAFSCQYSSERDEHERRRRREFDPLARSHGLHVQEYDQHARQSDAQQSEALAQQRPDASDQRDEGEGPKPRLLA